MFLQIGLGLLPAVVLLGVFAVIKRKHLVKLLYSAGVFATASATAFVCAGVASQNSIEEEITSPAAVITAQADKQFESAYALALNKDYSGAEEVLSDYCINGIHTSEFTAALARVNALNGNYEAAVMLYEKAGGDDFKAELEACKKALEFKAVDVTLGKINTSLYGAETAQLVKQAEDAFSNVNSVVTEAVSKEVSDDFTEAAELCKQANDLYDSYILTGSVDETACEALKEKFDKVSDSTLKSGYVRLSKLKVLVMTGSYDEIAENADEYSDYNELMILSELYVNGYIEEDDFSSSFKSGETEKYDTLSVWLYDLMEEEYSEDDESRNYEKAEEYIEYFDSYSSKPALSKVKDGLEEYAQVSDAADRSKAYMELAKIETYQGNQSASDECMTNALNTVGICRDENYTTPVYGVIQIIDNKEDNESLKNINTYVDDIITNSTTVKMNDEMYYQNPQEDTEKEPSEGENEEDNNGEAESSKEDKETSVSFDNYVSDFVSRKRSSLGILRIDTEKFPQVTATVSVDGEISYTSDELKNVLSLKDCGENIANLSIKKLNYSEINFLLCCDTSGSMDGQPIEDLKSAVRMFLENSNNTKVNYSLVTFTDGVNTTLPLGTDTNEIADTLDSISAVGGTNMYGAVKESLSQFNDSKSLNVIVLLSDGEDNSPASYDEIEANIGRICEDKNITIYSLGLGESCNAEYLSRFSDCTGGEYLYASGSETLSTFYDFIQNISANRYEVTFDAKNTTLESKRLLEIAVSEDDLVYASKYYSLNGEEEENIDNEQQVTEEESKVNEGLVVSGFDTKLVYASDSEVKIKLLGDKFTKDSFIRVSLSDILDYDIEAEYTSETEYTLTLPAGMACGAYDATIIIDGKKFTIENAITVALENGHETAFGKYIFTSVNKVVNGDTITLSGDVTMNGWLKFPGVVQLTGDFNSERIYVKPSNYGVISYSPETSTGLANLYSRVSNSFKVDMSNGFYVYKNGEDVEKLFVDGLTLVNLLTFNDIDVSVYPDRLEVEYNNFKPDLEAFDKLFVEEDNKGSGDDDDSPFGFELGETKAYFTNRTIDINIEITGEGGEGNYTPVKMGNFNYYVRPDELELKINTMEQEYEIKVIIQLAFLKDLDGFGFSAKWSSSLFPEELMFYADYNLTHVISGVPITFSDFAVGASDMVYTEDDDEYVPDAFFSMANVKPVYKWTFSGRADISAYKAKEMLPGIEKYVGDVSLLTLDDTTIALHLGEKYMSFNTELKLIEAVTLGKLDLKAGHIPYENELLGLDESVNGFAGKATVGIIWEADNVSLDVSASPEIAITDAFVGASVNGTLNAEFHWWIFEAQTNKQADVTIGFITDNNDSLDFTVRARWLEKKGKYDGFVISWTGSELECDTKYYS